MISLLNSVSGKGSNSESKHLAKMSATSPIWPEVEESHPLNTLHTELATLLSEEPAHKIWGITLSPEPGHFSTLLILQKFLRANKGDKEKAKKQFEDTLQWRRSYFDENGKVIGSWDKSKFEDLAYITEETVKSTGADERKKTIVTWNIYGHVKDFAKTFGDVEEYPSQSRSIHSITFIH